MNQNLLSKTRPLHRNCAFSKRGQLFVSFLTFSIHGKTCSHLVFLKHKHGKSEVPMRQWKEALPLTEKLTACTFPQCLSLQGDETK